MKFETRHASHPSIIPTADTSKLRELYHIGGIFTPDDVNLTFSHIERMIVGGVKMVTQQRGQLFQAFCIQMFQRTTHGLVQALAILPEQ